MPVFYFDYDRREHFSAPQFTRMRHRYRGVRESHKVNLEIDQIGFSLHKLYEGDHQFRSEFADKATLLMQGGPIPVKIGGSYAYPGQDVYPTQEVFPLSGDDVLLLGLEGLATKIARLQSRLKSLEG